MASAKPRGKRVKGSYRYQWRNLDRTYGGSATFTRARAYDDFVRKVKDTKASGHDYRPEIVSVASNATLIEMMFAYLQHGLRTAKAFQTNENRRRGLTQFGKWLSDKSGNPVNSLEAAQLSRPLLEEYDSYLATTGKRHKNCVNSRRTILGLLQGFWFWAFDRDEWDGLVPKPKRIELPEPMMSAVNAPDYGMVDAMIGQVALEHARRAAILGRFLALRIKQTCMVRGDDFDFARDQFQFRGELGKSRHEKKGRILYFPPELKAEMRTWNLKAGIIVPRDESCIRKAIHAAWLRSGAPPKYFHRRPNHIMRKTFRTEMLLAGCDSHAIEFWCGRRGGGQTDDYTDPRGFKQEAIAKALPPLALGAQRLPLLYRMSAEAA